MSEPISSSSIEDLIAQYPGAVDELKTPAKPAVAPAAPKAAGTTKPFSKPSGSGQQQVKPSIVAVAPSNASSEALFSIDDILAEFASGDVLAAARASLLNQGRGGLGDEEDSESEHADTEMSPEVAGLSALGSMKRKRKGQGHPLAGTGTDEGRLRMNSRFIANLLSHAVSHNERLRMAELVQGLATTGVGLGTLSSGDLGNLHSQLRHSTKLSGAHMDDVTPGGQPDLEHGGTRNKVDKARRLRGQGITLLRQIAKTYGIAITIHPPGYTPTEPVAEPEPEPESESSEEEEEAVVEASKAGWGARLRAGRGERVARGGGAGGLLRQLLLSALTNPEAGSPGGRRSGGTPRRAASDHGIGYRPGMMQQALAAQTPARPKTSAGKRKRAEPDSEHAAVAVGVGVGVEAKATEESQVAEGEAQVEPQSQSQGQADESDESESAGAEPAAKRARADASSGSGSGSSSGSTAELEAHSPIAAPLVKLPASARPVPAVAASGAGPSASASGKKERRPVTGLLGAALSGLGSRRSR